MATRKVFTAMINGEGSGGAFVTLPFDVEAIFGSKRPKVSVTFDGVPYRGTAVRMGSSDHCLIVRKDIREQIGKQPDDEVEVTVELDTEPRIVEMPEEFGKALRPFPEARAFFDRLSYTHQKEYVRWITEARREETRERRIAKGVEMLRSKVKTPD